MKCIICGNDATIKLKLKTTSLIQCTICGIVHCENLENNEFKEYYKNQYVIKEEHKVDSDIRKLSGLPEQFYLLSLLNHYKSPPANLVDFGCEKGYFLEEARRFGYKVVGIELSKAASDYCKLNDLVIYENVKLLTHKVDILTMNHSLEHLVEPLEFLSNIKDYMNEDAIISIRVPDYGSFWSKVLKSKWVWFQPHNHYFHYTIDSLTYLLEHTDFEIVYIKKRYPKNFKTYKAHLLADDIYKKYFNHKITFRNRIAYFYSWITGAEIIAVARKKNIRL